MEGLKFYRADYVFGKIDVVRVEKELPKSVVIQGSRFNKQSEYYSYHGSFGEAKEAIRNHLESRIQSLETQLQIMRSYQEAFLNIYNSKGNGN